MSEDKRDLDMGTGDVHTPRNMQGRYAGPRKGSMTPEQRQAAEAEVQRVVQPRVKK